jgi:DNA-binding NtrC family response regulator
MGGTLKVMIIDDERISLSIATAVLEDRGYQVVQRDSALGSLVAVRREKPDVVLLDVQMPGLNGDALTKLLLDGKSEAQPIVILHSTTVATVLEGLVKSCNAAGFIEKTADQRAFLQSFDRIVSRALAERGRQSRTSTPRGR